MSVMDNNLLFRNYSSQNAGFSLKLRMDLSGSYIIPTR